MAHIRVSKERIRNLDTVDRGVGVHFSVHSGERGAYRSLFHSRRMNGIVVASELEDIGRFEAKVIRSFTELSG